MLLIYLKKKNIFIPYFFNKCKIDRTISFISKVYPSILICQNYSLCSFNVYICNKQDPIKRFLITKLVNITFYQKVEGWQCKDHLILALQVSWLPK